jgi:hypothetical protein
MIVPVGQYSTPSVYQFSIVAVIGTLVDLIIGDHGEAKEVKAP